MTNLYSKAEWKSKMEARAKEVGKALEAALNIYPMCNRCAHQHGIEACGAEKHFKQVWKCQDEECAGLTYQVARARFWQDWLLCHGGSALRYNHLDGEVELVGPGAPPAPAVPPPPAPGPTWPQEAPAAAATTLAPVAPGLEASSAEGLPAEKPLPPASLPPKATQAVPRPSLARPTGQQAGLAPAPAVPASGGQFTPAGQAGPFFPASGGGPAASASSASAATAAAAPPTFQAPAPTTSIEAPVGEPGEWKFVTNLDQLVQDVARLRDDEIQAVGLQSNMSLEVHIRAVSQRGLVLTDGPPVDALVHTTPAEPEADYMGKVEALWRYTGEWFQAEIMGRSDSGLYHVRWTEEGNMSDDLQSFEIRAIPQESEDAQQRLDAVLNSC